MDFFLKFMRQFKELFKNFFSLSSSISDEEPERNDFDIANMPTENVSLYDNEIDNTQINDELVISKKDNNDGLIENELIICSNNEVTSLIPDEYDSEEDVVQEDKIVINDDNDNNDKTCLLDNKPYMKMAESLCSLINEIEHDFSELSSSELVDMVKERIRQCFVLSGADLIIDDKEFDIIRHTPVPAAMINKGTTIESFIEPGIIVENKVLRRAKVIITN